MSKRLITQNNFYVLKLLQTANYDKNVYKKHRPQLVVIVYIL